MEYLHDIFSDCGLNVSSYGRVHGGDINDAYYVVTGTDKYFLKVNEANKYPAMFEKEAAGLGLLRNHCSLLVPQVISSGIVSNRQYLLLEWLEKGSPQKDFWKNFGEAVASMHKKPQAYFGLNEDNYIGSLRQVNAPCDDWPTFYTNYRIMPLVKILVDKNSISSTDADRAYKFCQRIETIFPSEPASLLHGDLWGGNYIVHDSGYAALYDPAVYFGHREMDIGMTKLFGGFDREFYDSYNHTYPLEKYWTKRIRFTQLYPLLVHAVLFGGHYISSVKDIISIY